MSLRRIQTCEQCGAERELREDESADSDGWRTLGAGGLMATFCNACVRVLVTAAREAAEQRAGGDG